MSKAAKKQPTKAEREHSMKLLRRALRQHLDIDPSALEAKRKKKKKDDPPLTDPDEELAAQKKIERKGYASSVSGS